MGNAKNLFKHIKNKYHYTIDYIENIKTIEAIDCKVNTQDDKKTQSQKDGKEFLVNNKHLVYFQK